MNHPQPLMGCIVLPCLALPCSAPQRISLERCVAEGRGCGGMGLDLGRWEQRQRRLTLGRSGFRGRAAGFLSLSLAGRNWPLRTARLVSIRSSAYTSLRGVHHASPCLRAASSLQLSSSSLPMLVHPCWTDFGDLLHSMCLSLLFAWCLLTLVRLVPSHSPYQATEMTELLVHIHRRSVINFGPCTVKS